MDTNASLGLASQRTDLSPVIRLQEAVLEDVTKGPSSAIYSLFKLGFITFAASYICGIM